MGSQGRARLPVAVRHLDRPSDADVLMLSLDLSWALCADLGDFLEGSCEQQRLAVQLTAAGRILQPVTTHVRVGEIPSSPRGILCAEEAHH